MPRREGGQTEEIDTKFMSAEKMSDGAISRQIYTSIIMMQVCTCIEEVRGRDVHGFQKQLLHISA